MVQKKHFMLGNIIIYDIENVRPSLRKINKNK